MSDESTSSTNNSWWKRRLFRLPVWLWLGIVAVVVVVAATGAGGDEAGSETSTSAGTVSCSTDTTSGFADLPDAGASITGLTLPHGVAVMGGVALHPVEDDATNPDAWQLSVQVCGSETLDDEQLIDVAVTVAKAVDSAPYGEQVVRLSVQSWTEGTDGGGKTAIADDFQTVLWEQPDGPAQRTIWRLV